MWPIHLNMGFKTAYFYEGFYFFVSILVAAVWIVRRLERAVGAVTLHAGSGRPDEPDSAPKIGQHFFLLYLCSIPRAEVHSAWRPTVVWCLL
ncbi:hypothetical protein [Holophaga foetida]|uniref:hypothetical protein n=1 Tax=Holophaga foetida TaxID=35839 RepID=UPI0002475029|nr:hypothetical protein [Holophaga foetida]